MNGVHTNVEKTVETDKLWLKDFLPSHEGMPKLRVLLFGYNASAAFRTSTIGFSGAATNLLDQLRFKRLVCLVRCLMTIAEADDLTGLRTQTYRICCSQFGRPGREASFGRSPQC